MDCKKKERGEKRRIEGRKQEGKSTFLVFHSPPDGMPRPASFSNSGERIGRRHGDAEQRFQMRQHSLEEGLSNAAHRKGGRRPRKRVAERFSRARVPERQVEVHAVPGLALVHLGEEHGPHAVPLGAGLDRLPREDHVVRQAHHVVLVREHELHLPRGAFRVNHFDGNVLSLERSVHVGHEQFLVVERRGPVKERRVDWRRRTPSAYPSENLVVLQFLTKLHATILCFVLWSILRMMPSNASSFKSLNLMTSSPLFHPSVTAFSY